MNKNLHLIWLQSNNYITNKKMIPKGIKKNCEKFIYFNEISKVFCWSNNDIIILIKKMYPDYLIVYNKIKDLRFKSDLARLMILNIYGGYYLDVDEECLCNLDKKYINNNTKISIIFNSTEKELSNAFIYIKNKNNIFILNCLKKYIEKLKKNINIGACKLMKEEFDKLYPGYNIGCFNDLVIFKEIPIKKLENCKNKIEFWKSFKVFDLSNNIIFNSRYNNYYEDRKSKNNLTFFKF